MAQPTFSPTRTQHLDEVLTGLALVEAYTARDGEALDRLRATTDAEERCDALLATNEILMNVLALHPEFDQADITASIRRRVVHEIAKDH